MFVRLRKRTLQNHGKRLAYKDWSIENVVSRPALEVTWGPTGKGTQHKEFPLPDDHISKSVGRREMYAASYRLISAKLRNGYWLVESDHPWLGSAGLFATDAAIHNTATSNSLRCANAQAHKALLHVLQEANAGHGTKEGFLVSIDVAEFLLDNKGRAFALSKPTDSSISSSISRYFALLGEVPGVEISMVLSGNGDPIQLVGMAPDAKMPPSFCHLAESVWGSLVDSPPNQRVEVIDYAPICMHNGSIVNPAIF